MSGRIPLLGLTIFILILGDTTAHLIRKIRQNAACVTPSGEGGTCMPVTQCPELALSRSFDDLVKARCGDIVGEPHVCCSVKPVNRSPAIPATRPNPSRPGSARLLTLPSDCGFTGPPATKVIGGKNASIATYPWTVLLFIDSGLGYYPDCGGSLISKRHVVTAAHCVWHNKKKRYLDPSQLAVRLGEQNWRQDNDEANPVNMKVILIQPHEAFQSAEFRNDIAILTLEEEVKFTKNIHPICLPDAEMRRKNLTGTFAKVTGWGLINNEGRQADTLQEARLEIISNEDCSRIYSDLSNFTNIYLCAGNGEADACTGDSGGPLGQPGKENRYFLIGIVSFGRNTCGKTGVPGVYTRVSEFVDWITSKVIST